MSAGVHTPSDLPAGIWQELLHLGIMAKKNWPAGQFFVMQCDCAESQRFIVPRRMNCVSPLVPSTPSLSVTA